MDYDDYSHDDNSYDVQSYGCDNYDDVSHNDYDEETNFFNNALSNDGLTTNQRNSDSKKITSESAFERVINVLFDQTLDGSIANSFLRCYRRKNISDMIDINICSMRNEIGLNKSEMDLIMTLKVCNRVFTSFYGTPIQDDWSNVTTDQFDDIGENLFLFLLNVIQRKRYLPPLSTITHLNQM